MEREMTLRGVLLCSTLDFWHWLDSILALAGSQSF